MHIPVLLKETIKLLDPKPNENFIDCTFGRGGHSGAILEKTAPDGIVIGLDWDNESLESFRAENQGKMIQRLILENLNFAQVGQAVEISRLKKIDGVLFDLGMSSWHVDESAKGFSFSKNEPLDMRYGNANPLTAAKIVNEWSAPDLEKIFSEYGEENLARKIAKDIAKARSQKPIETTAQLAAIIARIAGPQKVQSSARVFQALRIAVNHEFENIEQGLEQAFKIMAPGARMAVITFHSLEDRIVKNKFRELVSQGEANLINEKPITPAREEVSRNPRSRSAKLRAIVKARY